MHCACLFPNLVHWWNQVIYEHVAPFRTKVRDLDIVFNVNQQVLLEVKNLLHKFILQYTL